MQISDTIQRFSVSYKTLLIQVSYTFQKHTVFEFAFQLYYYLKTQFISTWPVVSTDAV